MLHLEQGLAHKRSQGSNEAVITEEKGKRKNADLFSGEGYGLSPDHLPAALGRGISNEQQYALTACVS